MRSSARSFGWPTICAGILLATGLFSRHPVADALTGESVSEVGLALPLGYLLVAPLSGLLDHLSLLTDRQHIAVVSSVLLLYILLRVVGHFANPSERSVARRVGREALLFGSVFVGLLAVYGYGVLGPRPMAALRATDDDIVIVDFHSHTEASHDGRPGLDITARRAWHEGAGFDLAWITDHVSLESALVAEAENPELAGEGLSFLPGREVRYKGQHIIVLGRADPTVGVSNDDPWPTLIQTIPNDLSYVPVPTHGERGGVHAIELVDADPRGLRQSVDERERILEIADSLDLALVASSNHHGWGRASAAWTLVRVPGWRSMGPGELGGEVEVRVRQERGEAVQVVERVRLPPGTGGGGSSTRLLVGATTLPRLVWHILTRLTPWERLAWLAWVGLASLWIALAGRGASQAVVHS